MTTADERPALTLTAHTPEDLLAAVPVVLGFTPTESVAMLTFGAARSFHARIDLPPPGDTRAVKELVDALLEPARRHRVERVMLVLYSPDAALCRRVATALRRAFERHGIGVVDLLRVDGGRWFPAVGRRHGVPAWGVPFDPTSHPFAASAVLDGRVCLPSRAALADTLTPVDDAVRAVEAEVRRLHADAGWTTTDPPPVPEQQAEGAWIVALVARHAADATVPDEDELARLVRALVVLPLRDVAWWATFQSDARAAQAFWVEVVRRTPPPLLAAPATLLAFAAWTAGHGAMAWCAVDVAERVDPTYSMMGLVRQMLVHAVPPQLWTPRWHWTALWDDDAHARDDWINDQTDVHDGVG